jgi:hypothetical protein
MGQEFFDDDISRGALDRDLPERLAKVEDLLSRLMEVVSAEKASRTAASQSAPSPAISSANVSSPASGTPPSSIGEGAIIFRPKSHTSSSNSVASSVDVCRRLHKALLSQRDADILFKTGRMSTYLRLLCNPYDEIFNDQAWLPDSGTAFLPDHDSHPILLARALLQLAVCIQQLDPSFDSSVLDTLEPLTQVMQKYVELAVTRVLSNESWLDSQEALECLMLQAVWLINAGQLRLALLHVRRVVTISQLLGIHRLDAKSLRKLDHRTQVACPVIWGRLLWLERYLSLLLSMPTATASDNPNLRSGVMTAVERMDMAHTSIFARVINRNQMENQHDFNVTLEIDHEIQHLANSFPARWWVAPAFHPAMDAAEMLSCIVRAQTQIIHFNLLNITHLPYILRDASDKRYDYNKMTCMAAAREVLGRYISFRSVVRVVFCCRPVDFCALTAALSLLLAHLDSHQNSIGDAVAGRRLEDRALIERALVALDELNRVNDDELSRQTARLARRLLLAESDAAAGGNLYAASDGVAELGVAGQSQRGFAVQIPSYRAVKVMHEAVEMSPGSRGDAPNAAGAALAGQMHAMSGVPGFISSVATTRPPLGPEEGDRMVQHPEGNHWHSAATGEMYPELFVDANVWPFQGVDAAFLDAVLQDERGFE